MMIPPSSLGVLLASIAMISIGKLLIAIMIPGMLMAVNYALYIVIRCKIQPSLAPNYEVAPVPLLKKLEVTVRYILPLGFIIFLVTGVILIGIATPSEAAAMGALGCFILAGAYRKLNWTIAKESVLATFKITAMMFLILTGATAFSQILAASGGSRGLVEFAAGLSVPPLFIIIAMEIVVLIMGMFMEVVSILMVCLPIFMPVINALGFDPIWFGVTLLLNVEIATTSPPFGVSLFVMKSVAPADTTMGDIYLAGLPFIGCDLISMSLIIAFPQIALWLPSIM